MSFNIQFWFEKLQLIHILNALKFGQYKRLRYQFAKLLSLINWNISYPQFWYMLYLVKKQ